MADARGSLREDIVRIAAQLRKFKGRELSEAGTKTSFIEPVLEALGWNLRDPDEVSMEYGRSRNGDNPVDYALVLMGKPRLFLEAKSLGRDLTDGKTIRQALNYANNAGVTWCVLSNGDHYHFYKASDPAKAEEKIFWKLSLTEDSPEEVAQFLRLISRECVGDNLLEQFWRQRALDRDVKGALEALLARPDAAIVKLVSQDVTGRTPKEIAESIRRLVPHLTIPTPDLMQKPRREKRAEPGVRRVVKGELAAILAAGILQAPVTLRSRYKDGHVEATLQADGQILFDGKLYGSCSAAGAMGKKKIDGIAKATNGWVFWTYRDASGREVPLAEAREALGGKRGERREGAGAGA